MNYQIFEPCNALEDFVKCYWTLESPHEGTPRKNTIVPDGTMKMIFHYGDLYWHHPPMANSFLQPRCFVIGQLTRPYVVEPEGDTGSFVVRFHPNGFFPFATLPIKEMENTAVSLERLYGSEGKEIEEAILNAENTSQRIKLIESYLLNRLADTKVTDQIVKSTIEIISTGNGQFSVNELSRQTKHNRRQLSRKFSSSIGLSPKQLSKIIRLQVTLKTLLNEKAPKLTDLAYENEYYDQAHFIKDFKEFTGLTPKEFYGDDLKMSLIFDSPE